MPELTREEILAMPAGREMDALIAEYAMEIMGVHKHDFGNAGCYWVDIRMNVLSYYSEQDAAALEVVKRLAVEPFAWAIETINTKDGLRYFVCYWGDDQNNPGKILDWSDEGESLALTVGHVALLAKLTKAEDW